MAAAVPALITAGGAIGASLLGKKMAKGDVKRSDEEAAAYRQWGQAGQRLFGQGLDLTEAGLPWAKQAGGYYSTLLGGNRAAMNLATAAPRADITDVYRGAERGLERQGIRGGARETAMAELNRDRAAKIAGLTTGVQPWAAQNLFGAGSQLTQQGTAAETAASQIFGGQTTLGQQNRQWGKGQEEKAGASMGALLGPLITQTAGKFGKKGGAMTTPPGTPIGFPGIWG